MVDTTCRGGLMSGELGTGSPEACIGLSRRQLELSMERNKSSDQVSELAHAEG